MQDNPEIKEIIESAVKIAQHLGHEYVTTEHLLLSMVRHPPFRKCLDSFGVEVEQMDSEIEHFLVGQITLVSGSVDSQPRRTVALERIFNRANVQVVFSGRRAIATIDMYLSIMAENNSHAHYFLLKYGVKKQEFVDFWSKTYKAGMAESGMSSSQADEILNEYCENLSRKAEDRKSTRLNSSHTDISRMPSSA